MPSLAQWLLALGIVATLAANVAHGLGHGLIGAMVAAWPAIALVGSYELLMMIIRSEQMPAVTAVTISAQDDGFVPIRLGSVLRWYLRLTWHLTTFPRFEPSGLHCASGKLALSGCVATSPPSLGHPNLQIPSPGFRESADFGSACRIRCLGI